MKKLDEIRKELTDAFDGKDLKVNDQLLSVSPHFADYVRMGHYLSCGSQTTITGTPSVQNALIALDADMTNRINKTFFAESRAIKHFDQQQTAYATKKAQPDKDRDFSKLLTASLDAFERKHGFVVVGDRLPNYAGFVFGNVFKESLALKQHWKDVGAGPEHGEYTHRLQWYIMISAGVIQTVPAYQEATIFASIAPWQKGKTNLWTFLFDQLAKDPSIGGDKLDFRSPENLNMWLVGDALPDFCPVLRAFLRARMAKRQSTYDMEKYLAKKLGKSKEDVAQIMEYMRDETMAKRNPSARIAYPKSAKPELAPYVRT
ncbi:LirA/MavJ family T4SS effector [Paraburkholderia sp. MM5384-R2]|uniref:LirA/MavJ family T4SS effector n=1 Tax=Paraburkholderia sp. MM5384-R2 TaxID=2723097 RepID=UPI00161073E6|nr:LirA/MavJ family T4SS effector [Paraburkholderia sp. MM5384-R2]MBB5497706.1 hypothetical protein [Paraburkholderia sp. MM5384-R2]